MIQEIVVWIVLGLSLVAALWYVWRSLGFGRRPGRSKGPACGDEGACGNETACSTKIPDCADCPVRETCGARGIGEQRADTKR